MTKKIEIGITPKKNPTLFDKGIFFISGEIESEIAKSIVTWILEANMATERDYDHLTLMVNSPGGEVPSCFAIIDIMRGSTIPIHTIGLGQISSCGLSIFMAGAKGHRTLTPNTQILSHQWAWGKYGKEHELMAVVREYELINDRIMKHYQKCTGLSEDMIREKLLPSHDVFLSAEEAKALNICDNIKTMR